MKTYEIIFTTTAHGKQRLVISIKAYDLFQATAKAHNILLHRYGYSFQIL